MGNYVRGKKHEVFPFKDQADIDKLLNYFLDKYRNATQQVRKDEAIRNYLFCVMGINMGLRGGDLLALTWGDVMKTTGPYNMVYGELRDDPYYFITEQKTGKKRQLVMNADVKRALLLYWKVAKIAHLHPWDPIFTSAKSGLDTPMSLTGIDIILKNASIACGIPYNVASHSLRKTFGYRYFKATNDIATLQKIFNHTSPAITLKYIGIDAEVIKSAYDIVSGAVSDTSIYDELGIDKPETVEILAADLEYLQPEQMSTPKEEEPQVLNDDFDLTLDDGEGFSLNDEFELDDDFDLNLDEDGGESLE